MRTATIIPATVMMLAAAAMGQTHAPWPADWNNWNDPALMVTVGDPGNAGELSGAGAGGTGHNRICGQVDCTYKICTFEVTAGQYTAFLSAVAETDAYGLYNAGMANTTYGSGIARSGAPGSYVYSVDSDHVSRPANYVSWADAARFANWLHNGRPRGPQGLATTEDGAYYLNGATSNAALMAVTRKPGATWAIPSEDEWYKAAYYKGGSINAGYWDYPTASNTAPGRDTADASGNSANYLGQSPNLIDPDHYTTLAGEFQNSPSPYGTFDQGGNVWEWNESVQYGEYRGLRGGSAGSADYHLQAANRDDLDSPSLEAPAVGFRLVQVPEPGMMALLGIAGLAELRKRRK
ncbi:MAG: SUMF1/EgtB/PvdO family nonheme iron enzyme [Planctomycetota bacterium]|nr:SUMF1/EgtB/PvdO family nonheme iron enzyme [Planctomycetota bacterium]